MVASKAGVEQAGSDTFTERQNKLFGQGFSFSGFERDALYLNLGSKKYLNISGVSGIDSITDGRGAVFADFDNDGDTDIFLTTIQGEAHLLFRNNLSEDDSFIRVTLEGVKSGKDAFGSLVRVKTSAGVLTKVKSGGAAYLSQSDPRLTFGLGSDAKAEWVEVVWASGLVQKFENIPQGSSMKITEGDEQVRWVEEKRFQLPEPIRPQETRLMSLRIKKGGQFPNLALSLLDGERTSLQSSSILLDDPIPGRKYLVNLWATWCLPCAKEMPELQKLYARNIDSLEIMGISLDHERAQDKVKSFLSDHGIQYPIYLSDKNIIEQIYATDEVFVPLSFLLDQSGKVMEIFSGWSEEVRERLIEQVDSKQ